MGRSHVDSLTSEQHVDPRTNSLAKSCEVLGEYLTHFVLHVDNPACLSLGKLTGHVCVPPTYGSQPPCSSLQAHLGFPPQIRCPGTTGGEPACQFKKTGIPKQRGSGLMIR